MSPPRSARETLRRVRRWTRPTRHWVAYLALRGLVALLRAIPLNDALVLGAGLGRLVGVFARSDRRWIRANLRAAAASGELARVPSPGACFADLGRRFAELANRERMMARIEVPPEARALLDGAAAASEGTLVATAHLGNWELCAARLAALGYDVASIAARPGGGPLFRWLDAERNAAGVRTLPPAGGARQAVTRLRAGLGVAVFIDQRTRERARDIRFFGRPAPTPLTFERLLASTGARPLWIFSARDASGLYRVRVESLPTGPLEDPLADAVARLQEQVAAHPEQWVWQHARWGTDSG